MIDFAWSEFLFIALLALILLGPKELPIVLKYVGRIVGKVRMLANEFLSQLDIESMTNLENSPDKTAAGNEPSSSSEDQAP